ncbi:histidinol-phosphate transaminase [Ideonella livida]|uniref:Histidinol-phosphate aminotransferase n=1 Tax=Ideonella livida TaxID=2707176 RepID=A0A7C9TMC8_9BURK|nr:histidinol-phosphate transaminase [Ideonella livida]NDY92247.1 histidinol-phosphate transaminase [Ideonella livida]
MSRFWSDIVHSLTPYVPGEQPKIDGLVKLNTNECPFGPPDSVVQAIAASSGDALRLYPDPTGSALKDAVARFHAAQGITPTHVFVGNGSDEVLAHIFMALLRHPAPLLAPDISYSFYPVYAKLYGITLREIPLAEDFSIRVDDFLAAGPNGGIIFPNPNAPTGMALPLAELCRLLDGNPDSVVVVDEAYVDFGAESADQLVTQYPQLLVVRTLSKSRALAGLRVGYALGQPELIEALTRVKDSFNSYPLDRLALAGGVAAMDDVAWFQDACARIVATRSRMTAGLQARGAQVLPSAANFVFATFPGRDAEAIAAGLRGQRVLVRHFRKPARIAPFLRISVGTEAQTDTLLAALDQVLPTLGRR